MGIQFKQVIDRFLGILLIIPNVILAKTLGTVLQRDHSLKQPPDHILVVKILGLGSMVMATESIAALRRQYPNVNLILLCNRNLIEGIQPADLFDEYWGLEDQSFLKLIKSSIQYLFKSWKLKNLWTIDLEIYSKLTTIFTLWSLAKNRFGFQLKSAHFRNFLNTHNEYFNHFCSVSENYRQLIKRIGIQVSQPCYFPEYLPYQRSREFEMPYIAINNTCSELAYVRKLPDQQLRDLCRWLLDHTNYNMAFCGAPSDFEENEGFINRNLQGYEGRILNLAGKYRIKGFYDFLFNQCAFMVSVDSAPLHIAKKLGLPTISCWGPTNPLNYLEIAAGEEERHLYYYLGVHCSPCIHHSKVLPCGGDNFCMKNMSLDHLISLNQTMINHLHQKHNVNQAAENH